MLEKDDFIQFILAGPRSRSIPAPKKGAKKTAVEPDALGGFGFDDDDPASAEASASADTATFARQLLEASGFGAAQFLATEEVILGNDPARKYLPEKVYYWPKGPKRPYQTILFELAGEAGKLLNEPLFSNSKGVLEDALSRLVQNTLKGFETGGAGKRDASVKQGRQDETLCVVSIRDERNRETGAAHLVCFGTVARGEGSLETFHIREEARHWEPQLAKDHLERLYDRHFKKLATTNWQDAFISGEERKLARKLMDVCQGKKTDESRIQTAVVDLLEEIALSYGLRKHPKSKRRLEATDLPQDHDIGISEEVLSGKKKNPFKGMTLRDEKNRLLGYIIYCLDQKEDAELLRQHLKTNNRFHNVLVVYPNGDSTGLELWQGRRPLEGKLTKSGAKFEGEGKVVNLLSRFFVVSKALVANPAELAAELAYRARYLRAFALRELEKPKSVRDKDLEALYESFHEIFLKNDEADESKQHDQFADSYAQTLTYGLLSARWISKEVLRASRDRFTLDNASDLLERTSPFFKELFTQVISKSHDASRDWLLQDITDLLDRIDIDAVFATVEDDVLLGHDPVMHFYEPFLAAYDAQIKRQRGVFYTPHPVVSYIVRSVDELLQTEFGLEDGLADTTTWGEMLKKHKDLKLPPLTDEEGEKRTIDPGEPFVQILDPATGTATFLVEVIDVIHRTLMTKWEKQGLSEEKIRKEWNEYVPKHLLPRLFGYELMMAPYAIAHLKIGIKLAETGYSFGSKERARVYLTNALEPATDLSGRLSFAVPALARETKEVNEVKRRKRFTVVVGNPPYSGHSRNNEILWIVDLVRDFTRDEPSLQGPGQGKWLQDDYVKFLRLSQHLLVPTKAGILAMITNHRYLTNRTFKGMRRLWKNHFSLTRILDLHGNRVVNEVSPVGHDENVFDIDQGVTIGIFAKGGTTPSSIGFQELWGPRMTVAKDGKYDVLAANSLRTTAWEMLNPRSPNWLFSPREEVAEDILSEFESGIKMLDLMPGALGPNRKPQSGLATMHDGFAISFTAHEVDDKVQQFLKTTSRDEAKKLFGTVCNPQQWDYATAKRTLLSPAWRKKLSPICFSPFDTRYTVYDRSVAVHLRRRLLDHFFNHENLGLVIGEAGQEISGDDWDAVSCVDSILQLNYFRRNGSPTLPLYLYDDDLLRDGTDGRRTNLSLPHLKQIAERLGLQVGNDALPTGLTPEDIFHYAYAVFHSPGYRSRYAEFLKIDFPRLPLTSSLDLFRALSKLGAELTALHLLESPALKKPLSKFKGASHEISKPGWTPDHAGTVWIDAKGSASATVPGTSGFQGVPEAVWNFHIGGYQVCHKWLKDRKGRTLTDEDITHYHQIVVALSETIRLMAEIDEVIHTHGGWPGAFSAKES